MMTSPLRSFRSSALQSLWSEIEPISNPQHPFLDRSYSPASNMPAADFSPWIADRYAAGDWNSIIELLLLISNEHETVGVIDRFKKINYAKFIDADTSLLNELMAIAILLYRIQWTGYKEGQIHLLSELFTHALTCRPFRIRADAMAHLIEGGNKYLRKRNLEFRESLEPRPLVTPESLRKTEIQSANDVQRCLAKYPITFRCCLAYSLERGSSVSGTIRLQMQGHYGLRQVGLSLEQNTQFIGNCGMFEPPSDVGALADSLKKDELLKIARQHNVAVTKSWKKGRIIAEIMMVSDSHQTIAQTASREIVQVRSEFKDAFSEWHQSIGAVEAAAICLANV